MSVSRTTTAPPPAGSTSPAPGCGSRNASASSSRETAITGSVAYEAAIRRLGEAAGVDAFACLDERGGPDPRRRKTRLLRTTDNWIAVTMARADDIASVPAWLGVDVDEADSWPAIVAAVARRSADEAVARARLLGIAAAVLGERTAPALWHGLPVAALACGPAPPLRRPPVVANLASLWAGPLCGRILATRGAAVSKPEVITREALLAADVVIEGSRPRALEQMGIDAVAIVREGPRVWLSITGHGRTEPQRNWIGFGDDAAVAAGLVTWTNGVPDFYADAVADPLTGMTAAAAIDTALRLGGRWLIDCSLSAVAAHVAA